MTDKELGTAAGEIFTKAFTLGYETGREYVPVGGMALTAEQVEDVEALVAAANPYSAPAARLRALFPATEPAEDNGNICAEGNSSPTVVHVHHHDIEAHAASFNEGYDEAMRQLAESESVDIESLIEKSSLGTEAAQAAIDSVPPEHGRLIVAVAEQRAKTEALAKFMYEHGNPDLSQEDREILGPWEAMDEVTQKIWITLADAAYIHIADEIDSEKELLTEKVNQLQEQVKHLSRVAVHAAEHGIPAPAEPAEEETKAERRDPDALAKRMAWIWHDGWDTCGERERDYLRRAAEMAHSYYFSSPVVPAPTETGPWQRIEDVPEGVLQIKDRHGRTWLMVGGTWRFEWHDGNWHEPHTNINAQAPFVAAKEG